MGFDQFDRESLCFLSAIPEILRNLPPADGLCPERASAGVQKPSDLTIVVAERLL